MANDVLLQIAAFSSQVSYKVGEDLQLSVTVAGTRRFRTQIIRLGWYRGQGGRVVRDLPEQQGTTQPKCTAPDNFGMLECPWSVGVAERIASDWVSGVYVAVLTTDDRFQAVVPFVVRDDRPATFVHVSPFNTYQAYNNFPDDGSANGRSFYSKPSTVKGSFNRPFSFLTGANQFLLFEPPVVQFLERSGYDVTYAADPDVDVQGDALFAERKGAIFSSHPEYWTRAQRAAVLNARDAGKGLAFIAANSAHWPVRYEEGSDRRHLIGYKDTPGGDPIAPTKPGLRTDRRYHDLGQAEQLFLGAGYVAGSYASFDRAQPLVTGRDTNHWAFAGSGLAAGQTLSGEYAGYEIDSFDPVFAVPPRMTVLMSSPFVGSTGVSVMQRSVVIERPGQGIVFNAGSMAWAWGLSPGFGVRSANNENAAMARITRNVLDRIATR